MLPLLPGDIQVLKMQHLKTYKIHKMPLAKRRAQPARDTIFVQNIVALAASLQRVTCGSMSAFLATKLSGLKTIAAVGEILSSLKNLASARLTAIKSNI